MSPRARGTTSAEDAALETRPDQHWRARPVLAGVLRWGLLGVPLVAASGAALLVGRLLPVGVRSSWWGLAVLLAVAVAVAAAVERAARRLLPIALLLKLSMIFPDRAPSRLKLARSAATRSPNRSLLRHSAEAGPVDTAELVLKLVTALGTHDRRTRGHCERVRLLCDMLGAELKLDHDARERLRWAALLHDVGKMRVPLRILNKPGRLTAREQDAMRQHPVVGAELAVPLRSWMGEWGEGILDHHEKYDGSGYPHGRAGHDISVAGRLIGLIDAFETMTAARPYKKAMATRTAREELARCAGTHFDPLMVRAFLGISLPRVLWAMGPLSFLFQLPFLRPLADTGARTAAVAPQAAGAAVVSGVAGAAVAIGGVGAGGPGVGVDLGARQAGAAEAVPSAAPLSTVPPAAVPPAAVPPATVPFAASSPAAPPPAPGVQMAAADRPERAAPAAVPMDPAGSGEQAGEAEPAPSTPRTPSEPGPEPAPEPEADSGHPAVRSGPPPVTSSRQATFTFRPGTRWQCQLLRNGSGESSRPVPCSGTYTVTVRGDGDYVMRIADAETREPVAPWTWTVDSAAEDRP
ncbi:MAG: HD-GYP domain-containing protein [Mycobacteriales bacterium]